VRIGVIILVDPFILEGDLYFERPRQDKIVKYQRGKREDKRGNKIRTHDAVKARSAAENGNELGLLGHFRGEKNNGDEYKQRAGVVAVIGNEHQVIGYDLRQGNVIGGEGGELILDVEYDKDHEDERDRKHERGEELPDDIPVEDLDHHNRCDICLTMVSFQLTKDPSMILLRASFTSHM
jgi:hypothetical protein